VAESSEADVRAVAKWVMHRGDEFCSENLREDSRVRGQAMGAVLALPLAGRERRVGALVAFDRTPASQRPKLATRLLQSIKLLLEPAAMALESALLLKRAEELSVTDDLTQLYNSRYLNLVLRKETKRASRSGRPLSLLFIDLDGFKASTTPTGICSAAAPWSRRPASSAAAPVKRTWYRASVAMSLQSCCPTPAGKAHMPWANASATASPVIDSWLTMGSTST
jgi:hypothetical protein